MNTIRRLGLLALVITLPLGVQASGQPAEMHDGKTWRGTITAVDASGHTLSVKRALLTKKFNLGEHCAITAVNKQTAALTDLRPGEKVIVRYQDAEGVLVANRIAERALHYHGTVNGIDQNTRTVTMEQAPLYKPFRAPRKFRLANDCKVTLWNGREGTLADMHPGDRISITYELPDRSPVAYRIGEKSSTFLGALEAVDLPARTVKAREKSSEKKFNLADDCRIIVSGEKAGHMKDLVRGQPYRFTYEEVNGVNVLERIAPAQVGKPAETASAK